uniref:Uncharacterized protein n=1 Tax=Arcella intermedia TaxID=1963864 RepID=A0A6B2KWK2_9EUKA
MSENMGPQGEFMVATGSTTGQICIWEFFPNLYLDANPQIYPKMFLTGQDPSCIIALVHNWFDMREVFVSVAEDGTIAIFSFHDGECLMTKPGAFKCEPTCVQLLSSRYLAAGGRSSEVEIFDLIGKKVIRRIEAHNTWIRELTTCEFGDTSALVTLTETGAVRFWNIEDILSSVSPPQSEQTLADKPLHTLHLEEPLSVRISPNSTLMLVLYQKYWMVYFINPLKKLLVVSLPETPLNAHFMNNYTVLIFTTAGKGYVYQLPIELINNASLDAEKPSDTDVVNNLEITSLLQLQSSNPISFVDSINVSMNSKFVVAGFDEGFLCLWDQSFKLNDHLSLPIAVGNFKEYWSHNLTSNTTSTLIIEDDLILINGYNDGTISVRSLPFDPSPYIFHAHNAKVNALLYIYISESDDNYLVTGSDDFYVKIWKIADQNNFELIWSISAHSGQVLSFYYPGAIPGTSEEWENRFFSIGNDRCVILYEIDKKISANSSNQLVRGIFGKHSSEIEDVRWIPEQDYLIISCADKGLSIWEIESAVLEQQLYGPLAWNILISSPPLSKIEKYYKVKAFTQQPITSFSMDGKQVGYGAPIQAIAINVKHMARALETTFSRGIDSKNLIYKVLTYFMPWKFNDKLDIKIQEELNLQLAVPLPSYGLISSTGRMSILLSTSLHNRWNTSAALSAIHTISTVSLCSSLETYYKNRTNFLSHILSCIFSDIPDKMKGYIDPSLLVLAKYWLDSQDSFQSSSRILFASVINRKSYEGRRELAQYWSKLLLNASQNDSTTKTKSYSIIVLGILGAEQPNSLTPEISNQVTNSIIDLLFQEINDKLRIAAVEILGRGFKEWSKHMKDSISSIIQKLFRLTLMTEQKVLMYTAHQALMLIGSREPAQFIKSIIRSPDEPPVFTPYEQGQAILVMGALVRKHTNSLYGILLYLVESVMKCISPHSTNLRTACLKPFSTLVHDLDRRYPMVTFHQLSQRLAVGTKEGTVIIYDLLSATRFDKITHSKCPVTGVAFEDTEHIASYSYEDRTIKLWKITPSFFGLMGANPTCVKVINVPTTNKELSTSQVMQIILKWYSAKELLLIRPWEEEERNYLIMKR